MVRFFFFQAEDGIRDLTVTGVQTCALPICLYEYVRGGTLRATGSGSITEGIGISRVTRNLEGAPIDEAVHIEDGDTVRHVYRLLYEEGLFLGSTSGIHVAAAGRVAHPPGPRHIHVTGLW